MAKKEEKSKIILERTYNVPLRKAWHKSPDYKRAKKAGSALRIFLEKHMKSSDIRIGKFLNKEIWKHGIRNPPHHVKVNVKKDDKDVVSAELVGAPNEELQKAKKESRKEHAKEKKTAEKKEEPGSEPAKTQETKEEKQDMKEAPKKESKPAEKKTAEKPAKK